MVRPSAGRVRGVPVLSETPADAPFPKGETQDEGIPVLAKKVDIGKWWEKRIKEALKSLERHHGVFHHRMKDSHAAGRIVGTSPADFLVAYNGHAQLWEAKASEVHPSLRSCLASMVSDTQVGYHQLWTNNKCLSFFLFYSDSTGEVEVWEGHVVVAARKAGRPLPKRPRRSLALRELELGLLGTAAER